MANGSIQVLLLEDDPGDSRLIRELLNGSTDATFQVHLTERLSATLERLAEGGIDVILSDMKLPDAEGTEIVAKLRAQAPATPIVVLTGTYGDEHVALQALQMGAQDYLVKDGVDGKALMRALKFSIERKRAEEALRMARDVLEKRVHDHTSEIHEVHARLLEAHRNLERLTQLDPLTDLLNRRGLQEVLSKEVLRVQRGSSLVVLLIGLDDFKKINNVLGYAVGDVVLKEVSNRLRTSLRKTDRAARVGGDEFILLLTDTSLEQGLQIAEKVRLAVSGTPVLVAPAPVRITASVGVLAHSPTTSSLDELLSQAHPLLSEGKRAGKNRVWADPASRPGQSQGGILPDILALLKKGDRFRAVMHPIYRLEDEKVIGYELLSRADLGIVGMPDDFFRLSLEANILTLVDHHCFRTCMAAASELPQGRRHVNLFPSTLLDIPMDHLMESFPAVGASGAFCVEISEQQIIGDPSYLVDEIQALKRAGILVAIDDVGFGRTCLESLILLEPDVIKIDRKCVSGVGKSPPKARALERLLSIAKVLEAEVVAEGIETRDDLEALKRLKVYAGQGYLWGKPGPLNEAAPTVGRAR